MKRSLLLNIHLVLSALFIPFLLIIPLSGSLYLLGVKGEVNKTEVMRVEAQVPAELKDKEAFFKTFFAEQKIDFDFEYIRETPAELIFRPTTRDYYTATVKDGSITLFAVKPSMLAKLMELHKGHGPQKMKKLEAAFGISLILILLTGLWLALTVPKYRKLTVISTMVGLVLLGAFLV